MKMSLAILNPAFVRGCWSVCVLLLLTSSSLWAQFSTDREPLGPSSRKTGLVLTEIMYNPRPVPGLSTNLTHEFIEVFNSKPWDEDIGGFSIGGEVSYLFPTGTVLRAKSYLVVARVPGLIETNYGATNVLGPWDGAETNRLSTERGVVQLRNRQGAVLLAVNYQDSPPWPEAADGTGHSLSLMRPSYGEDDFRAWSESDSVGGTPGVAEPLTLDPLAHVLINEWRNHSDPDDWIELYNHSNIPVDLSGAWLSDDPTTNKFRIPTGTIIPARGFVYWNQDKLGFELFAGGETIFFWNAQQTRVIDVIDFRGQSNNVSSGRWPDGGPITYGLTTNTRGAPNARPIRYPVVINEIMFNPISGDSDDEYVELYNRTAQAVNISDWQFVVGIDYTFPTNMPAMPAGAYWIVAKNPTNLLAIYTNLTTNIVFGPYAGTLANGGERLTFTAADYDRILVGGQQVIEKLPVPVSDLIYGDGGKWGHWNDGLGSSLELIDPEADTHNPASWADSNDTGESIWTSIEYNGPPGETLGSPINDSVILMLQGIGECLIDEVEVRADHGPNLVANGGFESGLSSWTLQGSHDLSTIENEGFAGTRSLHVRAGSRGDNQANRILSAPFTNPVPPGTQKISIRAKVRWLRGHPEFLVRLHGSATEAYGRLALPRRLGSPGTVNSRKIANAGPVIYNATHAPVLPAFNEPVVVSAIVNDPQGLSSVMLRYRLDPDVNYGGVPMRDDGTSGDAVANDGVFSGTIPGQAAGAMIAFYIEAKDTLNAIGTFPQDMLPPAGLNRTWPTDALIREALVRWGEVQMPGDFATYHLWVSAVNSNRWHQRAALNNTPMDGTFVYNNSRVIYNALPLFSGSPWHRTNSTAGPAGSNRVDYVMNFPSDEPLLGATDFVLGNPGNPDILTISDQSALAEQTVYKIFEGLGLVHNHRRYIHFFVNGSQRSKAYERAGNFIFEDSQQPNGDMIEQWFPNEAGGQLFKVEDWFEFDNNGFDIRAFDDGDLARRTLNLNGVETFVPGPYRFMFRKRSVNVGNSANDYSPIFSLIEAVSPAENPNSPVVDPDVVGAFVNWEAWMRHFAVQRAVGNFDSYGWERGKNDYLYGTSAGFVHMPWDIDYSLGLGRGPTEPLFASSDPRIAAMFNTPAILRAYWRAFDDLVAGPFNNAVLDPFIDARMDALLANNIDIDLNAVERIKTYIAGRRAFLQSQLATVAAPFAVAGSSSYSTTNNLIILTGTAPVSVKDITLNGLAYPVTWTSATNFYIRVVLNPGANDLVFAGVDRLGNPLPDFTFTMNVEYTGPAPDAAGSLVISEIMITPATAGAQFIEIVNRSAQNFDLWNWRLDGLGLVFPAGTIITNHQTVVLARNKAAFASAYGSVPVFAVFNANLSAQSQRLILVRPTALGDELIDGLRYEARAPWVSTTNGVSLQLIDLAQDNSRPSNWTIDNTIQHTPGAPNSVAAMLPPFDPLWLNELQAEALAGPLDNAGEASPWIELVNSGDTALSLDGYFLATNYATNLTGFPFPAGIILAPGEHRIIWADGEPAQSSGNDLHTAFRLDVSGTLALVRNVGNEPQITDYLTWDHLTANLSYGAVPDAQLINRTEIHAPSAGATNSEPPIRIFINEWMAKNSAGIRDPANNAQDDWFELYNAEPVAINLGGYYLSDDAAAPLKYQIPNNGRYQIPSRGFLVVWADNQTNQNSNTRSNLHVIFQLGGSAGSILMTAPDGVTLVDSITYGAQTNDIGEGRYSDGASTRYYMSLYTTNTTPSAPNSLHGYNSPPRFPIIAHRSAFPGQSTGTFSVRATDPDANLIIYAVESGPPGAAVNPSGQFRWIVPTNQPYGDYLIKLRATDNGIPSRSDTASFIVTVRSIGPVVAPVAQPPTIQSVFNVGGQATFTIETIPGHTYRILYTDDLTELQWTPLGRDFMAANPYASITDPGAAPKRFYQVVQLD